MAVRANIIEIYEGSNSRKRVSLIIKHYSYWEGIIEGCIENMVEDIRDEIRCNRRDAYGDLGVRVQTSGTSNPVESQVISETIIEEAIRSCYFPDNLLKDTDNSDKYIREAFTIRAIQEDINTFNRQFKFLDDEERQDVKDYITKKKTVSDFGEKWAVEDTTAYKRIEKLVAIVRDQTEVRIEGRLK